MKESVLDNHLVKDERAISELIQAIGIPIGYKEVRRIGKQDSGKKRPIKVVLSCKEDKDRLLRNLVNLKDQHQYKGISVTEDYTVEKRQLIKQWREEAIERNLKEDNSKYIWKLRGTPRSGLQLKLYLRSDTTSNERRTE